MIVVDFYNEVVQFGFHWKFWPQIIADKINGTFSPEEAKLKYIYLPIDKDYLKKDSSKSDVELRVKSNALKFRSNQDDDLMLSLPSCFTEKKFSLNHYNKYNSQSFGVGDLQ
jgi:hypothetical protein